MIFFSENYNFLISCYLFLVPAIPLHAFPYLTKYTFFPETSHWHQHTQYVLNWNVSYENETLFLFPLQYLSLRKRFVTKVAEDKNRQCKPWVLRFVYVRQGRGLGIIHFELQIPEDWICPFSRLFVFIWNIICWISWKKNITLAAMCTCRLTFDVGHWQKRKLWGNRKASSSRC